VDSSLCDSSYQSVADCFVLSFGNNLMFPLTKFLHYEVFKVLASQGKLIRRTHVPRTFNILLSQPRFVKHFFGLFMLRIGVFSVENQARFRALKVPRKQSFICDSLFILPNTSTLVKGVF
ncbi:MAG: hypothetical protein K6F52_01360, partial [Clostridia bacterium]|nr:hypothetical protein [Clostridia bacterium]